MVSRLVFDSCVLTGRTLVLRWKDSPIVELRVYTLIRCLSTLVCKSQACHQRWRQCGSVTTPLWSLHGPLVARLSSRQPNHGGEAPVLCEDLSHGGTVKVRLPCHVHRLSREPSRAVWLQRIDIIKLEQCSEWSSTALRVIDDVVSAPRAGYQAA
jgi:hypothetical protein